MDAKKPRGLTVERARGGGVVVDCNEQSLASRVREDEEDVSSRERERWVVRWWCPKRSCV